MRGFGTPGGRSTGPFEPMGGWLAWVLAVALPLVLTGCGGGSDADLVDPLPPDVFLSGWHRSDGTAVFEGAELYGHINGGAEVFLELGFESLRVQRYRGDAGRISVELYRMSDPAAALGVYLMKCGAERPDPGLAARHTVSPGQLQMLRGSAYVVVDPLELTGDAAGTLVAFARHVAGQIPDEDPGDLFGILPGEGRVPGSERLVRGPFTLEPLYTLGDGDMLSLDGEHTAVAAEYRDAAAQRYTRIVASYGNEETARKAFDHISTHLDSYLELLASDSGRLAFRDWSDRYGVVELAGDRVTVTVNLQDPPEDSSGG